MKKYLRLVVGLMVIIFGFSTFAYAISGLSRPNFVFPWGLSLVIGGMGMVVLGLFVIFTRINLKDLFEDIF